MNEYEKQAVDFCNKWGIEIKWCFVGVDYPSWDKTHLHNHWNWTLTRGRGSTKGSFWDSINKTEEYLKTTNKQECPVNPSEYDLLSCLTKEGYNSFEEFCDYMGYNKDSIKDYNLWKRVKLEYLGLKNVFGENEELWNEFREIC